MTRENAAWKSHRYLVEGRVVLERVAGGYVLAHVRGDGAIWTVTYRLGAWTCDCPARGRCAHMLAVGLVTAPTRKAEETPE